MDWKQIARDIADEKAERIVAERIHLTAVVETDPYGQATPLLHAEAMVSDRIGQRSLKSKAKSRSTVSILLGNLEIEGIVLECRDTEDHVVAHLLPVSVRYLSESSS